MRNLIILGFLSTVAAGMFGIMSQTLVAGNESSALYVPLHETQL